MGGYVFIVYINISQKNLTNGRYKRTIKSYTSIKKNLCVEFIIKILRVTLIYKIIYVRKT